MTNEDAHGFELKRLKLQSNLNASRIIINRINCAHSRMSCGLAARRVLSSSVDLSNSISTSQTNNKILDTTRKKTSMFNS